MSSAARRALLARFWPQLVATAWEELSRDALPRLGEWLPGARWWHRNDPEWDIVAESIDRRKLLVGEAKLRATQRDLDALAARPTPSFALGRDVVRVMFTRTSRGLRRKGTMVFDVDDVFRSKSRAGHP
jgi:hypothetical protein